MNVESLSRKALRKWVVSRKPDDHKGTYGHVLIAAGSKGMAGAAILSARAALRSGAGLVTVAIPDGIADVVAGAVPSAMTLALPQSSAGVFHPDGVDRLAAYIERRRVATMAIGPGVTTQPDAARFVLRSLSAVRAAAVVDADALNILAQMERGDADDLLRSRKYPCVITPHAAEAARLLGKDEDGVQVRRLECVKALSSRFGCVALLKGRGTLISSGTKTVVNRTGGPSLGKAGSGDVLTGLIAGLWAQMFASQRVRGDLAFQAAALGAWLHGAAGDAAQKEKTAWAVNSSDLIDFIPRAFKVLCA